MQQQRSGQYPQGEPHHKTRRRWPSVVLATIGAFFAWRAYSGGGAWSGAGAIILLLLAFLLIFHELWEWLGFGEKGEKTGLDLLQVLAAVSIPIMVAIVGYQFSESQNRSRLDAEQQRAQDEVLQAYLDQMGTLLLDEDLLSAQEDDEVRTLARTRTLTTLERVDGARKRNVVQFLNETRLIQRGTVTGKYTGTKLRDEAIVSLRGANLSDADLHRLSLAGEAPLYGFGYGNNLSRAKLSGADLTDDTLEDADLSGADLNNASLWHANLSFADLSDADLSDADLYDVDLRGADLNGANLQGARLTEANLGSVHLEGARGATDEQLAEAEAFKPCTMPDGSKIQDICLGSPD